MNTADPSNNAPGSRHVDRIHLSIHLADGGPLDEYVHTLWDVRVASGRFELAQIGADVRSIPEAPLREEGRFPLPYTLEIREIEFEWGASSAAIDVIMYLAAGASAGIVGNAAYDALKAVINHWVELLKAQQAWTPFPLDETEAIERTKLLVAERFEEHPEQLTLVESSIRPPDSASATVRGSHGTYGCDLAIVDGLVTFTQIRRWPSVG